MRAVIFSDYDFEPITVVELSGEAVNFIRENGGIKLAVRPDIALRPVTDDDRPTHEKIWIVHLRSMRIVTARRDEKFFLVTNDDETALLLKSAFLPGQQGALRSIEAEAYARGLYRGFREWFR